MKKNKLYLKLFLSTLYLSAFTFGGGYVIVPLLRKRFVEKLGWIEEEEMLDITAIAQSSPGAIAVNASILIGYRVAGFWGAIITVLGTITPPLIIISLLSFFYQAFRDSAIISAIMRGMQAGVAAVIFDVVISMGSKFFREKNILSILLMFCSFAVAYFFEINVIFIILFGILFCVILYFTEKKFKQKNVEKNKKIKNKDNLPDNSIIEQNRNNDEANNDLS